MLISSSRKEFGLRPGLIHDYRYDAGTGQWFEHGRVEAFVDGPPDPIYPRVGPPAWSTTLLLFRFGKNIQRFVEDAEGWQYRETIVPPDGMADKNFGDIIEVNERWVVFNANGDDTFGTRHGSVYVYKRHPDDTIEFFQKLWPPRGPGTPEASLWFSLGMSLDGDRLAVGSVGVTDTVGGQGAVYVYEFDGEQWTLAQEVVQAVPRLGSNMGRSVDLEGDVLVVGSMRQRVRDADVFRRGADGRWRQVALLHPYTAEEIPKIRESFGWAVATDGRWLAVSDINERPRALGAPPSPPGAIYAYDLECFTCEADLDRDGELTIFDYLAFQTAFGTGDMAADFDGDGELTIFDFLAFQTAFAVGCD